MVVGYITIKSIGDYNSINSVNLLCFIICDVDGYIEDKDGNKYLTFVYTDKNKEVLTKYTKLWDEIKYLIRQKMVVEQVSMKKISWISNLIVCH